MKPRTWLSWPTAVALLATLTPAGLARGGAPPEVVRVRVPSAQASAAFPPGAAVRTLAVEPFDALVAAAATRQGAGNADPTPPARIEHEVRWDGAALVGRTRVVLPATADAPLVVACDPWTPAVLPPNEGTSPARVDPSGRFVLLQGPHQPERVATIAWRQAALPGSSGRAFALRLPTAGIATLTLDLPTGIVPIARSHNAAPGLPVATPGGETTRWAFAGASGVFPIELRAEATAGAVGAGLWVGGATRIDLTEPVANWQADWQVERLDAPGPTTCAIDLDAGLELVDVAGPAVDGHRLVGPGRVEVTLRGPSRAASGPTALRLRGHVRPPLEGAWAIPSARPGGAGWLGGRTSVRLDPGRIVTGWVERSGRRVVPRASDGPPTPTLVFEADARPGPVAELQFGRPAAGASVDLEGTLRIGPGAPRVDLRATWTIGGRGLLDPTLLVPAGWAVDRVTAGDGRLVVGWHAEAISEQDQRVHLDGSTWPGGPPGRSETLLISAARVEPLGGLDAAFALPRIRPPATGSVRVADERWVAEVEPGWELVPTASSGLAWFDPSPPAAAAAPDDASAAEPMATPAAAVGQQLGWRWTGDAAEASVVRRRVRHSPRVAERLDASIVAGRLRLAWTWTVAGVGRPDALAFHLPLDLPAAPRWRAGGPSGPVLMLDSRPLDPTRHRALGFPMTGLAAEVSLHQLPPGDLTLRGEAEVPWSGTGSIPPTRFAAEVEARRSVAVRVEDAARFRVDRAEGWTLVGPDPIEGARAAAGGPERAPRGAVFGDDSGADGLRVAAAWVGDAMAGGLDVATVAPPEPTGPAGVITEAALASRVAPGTDLRHRLILRVAHGPARTLDLTLPAGATLDRLRRDGQPAVATVAGPLLRVVLAPTDPIRRTTTLTIDYRTPAATGIQAGLIRPAGFLPGTTLPCLSFVWQVNAPERFALASESLDLVATSAADRLGPEAAMRGIHAPPGAKGGDAAEIATATAMLADLDRAVRENPPVETTLGEWFLRLDAGRWPLVLDRLALQGIGWGPKSRINLADGDTNPARPSTARAVFQSLGLTLEPMGAALVVSTEAGREPQRTTPAARAALGRDLVDAAIVGADRSDRYQSAARWRGEATPRAWLASETPDRGLVATGWRSHRFVASSWPVASVAVRVGEARDAWRFAALGGAGIVMLLLGAGAVRAALRRGPGRRAGLTLAGLAGLVCTASARPERDEPIVAVLPYDDIAGVGGRPDRVLLLQDDHDRLVRAARGDGASASPRAWLVAATHHVARPAGGAAVVASRYEIETTGPGPASWTVPVGAGFDLAATVAGQPVPLAIGPDGRTATIRAIPPGRSPVIFRRSVLVTADPGGESVGVEVGRAAFARVEAERGDWLGPIDLPDLAGSHEATAGGMAGELGPRDRVEVRWRRPEVIAPPVRTELTALVRWEILPAGDRATARLTVGGRDPLRTVRLALGPGVAVLGASIPGLVAAATTPGAGGSEWVAHIDPPLGPGRGFEVTLWRAAPAGGSPRVFPRWGLVDGRLTGLVEARKPDDWAGRLVATPSGGQGPASEADFARAWGPAPADGLGSAGVARWDGSQVLTAPVAPEATRRTARGRMGVEVVPGGLKFVAEATLVDRGGASWEAEATFGGPVRLVRVEAAGLASWEQLAPDRVRLVFDGSRPARERVVRLGGTVAATMDEAGQATTATVPWPRWVGADAEPGTLIVAGAEGAEVRSAGRTIPPDPTDPARALSAAGPLRRSYAVGPAEPTWQLAWTTPTARVGVAVASDLQLDPERATWTTDVTCEAAGGPVATLHWKLPTAWAERASLVATDGGAEPQVQAEVGGESTLWTITFDPPTWHRRTFRLRSARPLDPGAGLAYPELAPLSTPGRGAVGEYTLAITNLSGRPIRLAGATGLVPLGPAPRRLDLPDGAGRRAFRVAGSEPWSLRIEGGAPAAPSSGGDPDRPARVERADIQLAVDATGRSRGQADCQVAPGAAFLAVHLDGEARLVAAVIAGRPAEPIPPGSADDTAGRWLIPLGDRGADRVAFVWVHPAASAAGGIGSSRLPRFDGPAVPASVFLMTTADRPDEATLLGGAGWTRLSPLEASLDRFERWGAEVAALAGRSGRDTNPAEAAVIRDRLVAMALELRAVDRASRVASLGPRPPVEAWHEVDDRVSVAIAEAGLGPLLDDARRRVGLEPPGADPGPPVDSEEIPDTYRIRQIGRVEHFRGTIAGPADRPVTVE